MRLVLCNVDDCKNNEREKHFCKLNVLQMVRGRHCGNYVLDKEWMKKSLKGLIYAPIMDGATGVDWGVVKVDADTRKAK